MPLKIVAALVAALFVYYWLVEAPLVSLGLGPTGAIMLFVLALLPNIAIIGTSGYGYPFPWLAQPFYPPGSPMIFSWSGLILDHLVWTVVAFLVIKLYQVLRKEESATALAAAKP